MNYFRQEKVFAIMPPAVMLALPVGPFLGVIAGQATRRKSVLL
jgi:hypothetical protein